VQGRDSTYSRTPAPAAGHGARDRPFGYPARCVPPGVLPGWHVEKGKEFMAHDADYAQMALLKEKIERNQTETAHLELRSLTDTMQRLEGSVDQLRQELLTVKEEIRQEIRRLEAGARS